MNDSWHQSFYDTAKVWAKRSTCIRRRYGSVIVDPITKHVVSTGYAGAPTAKSHCTDDEWCIRELLNIPQGKQYELCRSTHSEVNAILNAERSVKGCILYLYGEDVKTNHPIIAKPCFLCCKTLINAGITKVITKLHNNFIEIDMNDLYDTYLKELAQEYL